MDFTGPIQETRVPLVGVDVLTKIERIVTELGNRPDTLSAAAAFLQRLVTAAAEISSVVSAEEE